MAITVGERQRAPSCRAPRLAVVTCGFSLVLAAAPASGQQGWRLQPEIGVTATVTDNSGYRSGEQGKGDTIVEVQPRLLVYRRAPDYTLEGDIGAGILQYAEGTQENRVQPRGRLEVRSRPFASWLHLDASVAAVQAESDPYGGRAQAGSSVNEYTLARYAVSPYIEHEPRPGLSVLARADNVWTRRIGGDAVEQDLRRDAYVQQQLVRVEQAPQRWGYLFEMSREDTRYRYASATTLRLEGLRAGLTYAVTPQFHVGPTVGVERSRYSLTDTTDTVYGARARWTPTERSELDALLERRFFGSAWDVEWRHRSPFLRMYARYYRQPVSQASSQVLSSTDGTSVASMLDAMLTTRVADEEQRRLEVRRLISQLGLPETLASPTELFAGYAQLQQGTSLTVALSGVRTTTSITVYYRKSERLPDEDDLVVPISVALGDARQHGFEINLNRRLSPLVTLDVGWERSRIKGLAQSRGDFSREDAVRVRLSRNLSTRTSLALGWRRQWLDSSEVKSGDETAVFAAMNHRF